MAMCAGNANPCLPTFGSRTHPAARPGSAQRGGVPAAPPHAAQILQLGLDVSQQAHMAAAVVATVEAAIDQHGWPLWLQVQGSTLHVSCSRAELSRWRASGAHVLGVPLPEPLESQRTLSAVSGFLERWTAAEGVLHAALARDGDWELAAPPAAAEWPAAASAVAGAANALGVPAPVIVRALQLLTHLLPADELDPPSPPAPALSFLPAAAAQHAQHDLQISELVESVRAVQLREAFGYGGRPPVSRCGPQGFGPQTGMRGVGMPAHSTEHSADACSRSGSMHGCYSGASLVLEPYVGTARSDGSGSFHGHTGTASAPLTLCVLRYASSVHASRSIHDTGVIIYLFQKDISVWKL